MDCINQRTILMMIDVYVCSMESYEKELYKSKDCNTDVCVFIKHSIIRGRGCRIQERLLQRQLQHAGDVVQHCAGYDPAVRGGPVPAAAVYGTPTATVRRGATECVYLPALLHVVDVLQLLQRRILRPVLSPGLTSPCLLTYHSSINRTC